MNDVDYFEQLGLALDVYSGYEKFLLAGDFNIEEEEGNCLNEFLFERGAKNLVKDPTCFKNIQNPSCIDLFLTNSYRSFQDTTTVTTGLSDFHKMAVTVMKTTFPKAKPKVIQYRDYKKFNIVNFRQELRNNIAEVREINSYEIFESIFLRTLNKHAPIKSKVVRANDKPFMTKALRKAIMRRSALKNKFYKTGLDTIGKEYKTQKNYTRRLLKREKKKYFERLDIKSYTDNKKFWNTVKPLFSKTGCTKRIILVDDENIINDDDKIAETFNEYFINSVKNLDIRENSTLLTDTEALSDPVDIALKKYECHPSILDIKEHVTLNSIFSFSEVNYEEMKKEVKNLNTKKSGTFMDISPKLLQETLYIIIEPLVNIWNVEILHNKKFPSKLKLADLTPIFKKLDTSLKENYRPVSILPVVSKIFERLMERQMKNYIEIHLSPYLCGYRKGFNAQHAVTAMIEIWKKWLDKNDGLAGAVFMDLSKAFDTINHELLIAKLDAYGFSHESLKIILDYLSDRWQRTKVNTSFSSWAELLLGVPQGSILGPLLFNIYLNDLFFQFVNTHPCNYADDTTISACSLSIEELLHNLEQDTLSAIIWFENNYMKLNQSKCHFMISGTVNEHLWIRVGEERIWETIQEKLLGVTIDKDLKFDSHISTICKKAGQKVSALARVSRLLPFHRRREILKAFIESQFSHCPLVWMFCSRKMNRKINHIHERALRIVYNDYISTFDELLIKDKTVSIHYRNLRQLAIEMYKVYKGISPPFMKELFTYVEG